MASLLSRSSQLTSTPPVTPTAHPCIYGLILCSLSRALTSPIPLTPRPVRPRVEPGSLHYRLPGLVPHTVSSIPEPFDSHPPPPPDPDIGFISYLLRRTATTNHSTIPRHRAIHLITPRPAPIPPTTSQPASAPSTTPHLPSHPQAGRQQASQSLLPRRRSAQ